MDPVNEYAEIVKKYTQSLSSQPQETTPPVLGPIPTPTHDEVPNVVGPMPEPQLPPLPQMPLRHDETSGGVGPKPNVSVQMDPPLPPPMPPASSGNSAMVSFFKLTTFLSFILLVIVCTKLVLNFQALSKPTYQTTPTPSVVLPTPTTASVGSCLLNDQTYALGQTFPAQDGCNTCTCATNDNIVCTEKACISTSPAKTNTKPTSTPKAMPTLKATATPTTPAVVCKTTTKTYQVGDSYKQDCNTCLCTDSGESVCTQKICPTK